LTLVC